jgi:hypothetical protein
MALGFSHLEQERRCEVMDECVSGFAGHPRGLFYWLRECIGSDDWLACVIGIPSGRVFSPECEGFLLNSAIPELRIFCGFCAKGHLFSRVRLKQSSRMRLRRIRLAVTDTKESSQYKHGN